MDEADVALLVQCDEREIVVPYADLSGAIREAERVIRSMAGIPLRVQSAVGDALLDEGEIGGRVLQRVSARLHRPARW